MAEIVPASLLVGFANDSVMLPAYLHYSKWTPFSDGEFKATDCSEFKCVVTDEGRKYELDAAAMCFFFAYFSGTCHLIIAGRIAGNNLQQAGSWWSALLTSAAQLSGKDEATATFFRVSFGDFSCFH